MRDFLIASIVVSVSAKRIRLLPLGLGEPSLCASEGERNGVVLDGGCGCLGRGNIGGGGWRGGRGGSFGERGGQRCTEGSVFVFEVQGSAGAGVACRRMRRAHLRHSPGSPSRCHRRGWTPLWYPQRRQRRTHRRQLRGGRSLSRTRMTHRGAG